MTSEADFAYNASEKGPRQIIFAVGVLRRLVLGDRPRGWLSDDWPSPGDFESFDKIDVTSLRRDVVHAGGTSSKGQMIVYYLSTVLSPVCPSPCLVHSPISSILLHPVVTDQPPSIPPPKQHAIPPIRPQLHHRTRLPCRCGHPTHLRSCITRCWPALRAARAPHPVETRHPRRADEHQVLSGGCQC